MSASMAPASAVPALDELDELLAHAHVRGLHPLECERCVALLAHAPGRTRDVAEALAAQRSAPAVDALLRLPASTPGMLEGLFQAFRHGVARAWPDGRDGERRLALDFRDARARDFADVVARAHAAFGRVGSACTAFERLEIEGRAHYRVLVRAGAWPPGLAADVVWLHRRLGRLKGTRLWLNGWCFSETGPVRTAPALHLVEAWLDWAHAADTRESR